MSRPGISYLDVAKAATQLYQQNIRPSIEEVRRVLGTGSNSTINRHLRAWREKQGHQLEAEQGLPDTLLIAVKGIYTAMQEEAADKISTIMQEYTEKTHGFTLQIDELTTQNTKASVRIIVLENQLTDVEHKAITLQKHIDQLNVVVDKKNSEHASLETRLQDKVGEIERLTTQLNCAQNNLTHYRESIRLQREKEKQEYDASLNKLEQQLQRANQAQAQIPALLEQLAALKQQHEQSEQKLANAVEKAYQQALELQRQEIGYQGLVQTHELLKTEQQIQHKEALQDKKVITELTIQLEKSLERVDMLLSQQKKMEDRMSVLQDKNLFLTHEKAELALQMKHLSIMKQL